MGFSVLPTNVGGVSINSIAGPLASLLGGSSSVSNLTWPSDLGSNPAMGHAVVFQAFDRTTALQQAIQNYTLSLDGTLTAAKDLLQAPLFNAAKKAGPLATVSLFMPDTVNVTYNSSYGEVSMTEELGILGKVGNALSDINEKGWIEGVMPYAASLASNTLGFGGNMGEIVTQQLNQFTNPKTQLLYRGIDLRTFQLEFLLTPKSSAEAKTIQNICDTFVYYSLPGLAGAQVSGQGQFLTPPQVFSVQFKFLGQNGIIGNVSNVISSALTNSGLGFLTSSQNVANGNPAKTFTVGDCVLENVSVDYAPNGWATYNDGYPVQTRLTLQFKETQMYTKQDMSSTAVAQNYGTSPSTTQNSITSGDNGLGSVPSIVNTGGLPIGGN
jgi:hypothetical protein